MEAVLSRALLEFAGISCIYVCTCTYIYIYIYARPPSQDPQPLCFEASVSKLPRILDVFKSAMVQPQGSRFVKCPSFKGLAPTL